MIKSKLMTFVLALSVGAGLVAGAAAYVDAHQQEPTSVQAGECEWGSC
ncbi:hypothetical protein [Nonomuraea sp. B5E05]